MGNISAETMQTVAPNQGRQRRKPGSQGGGEEGQYMWGHTSGEDIMGPLWDGPVAQRRDMVALTGRPWKRSPG